MSEPITQNQPMTDAAKQLAEVAAAETTHGGTVFTPQVDILESEDELTLQADMPGVDLEGVDIHFEHGELTLHGRVAPREDGVQFMYREYDVGDFHRSFKIGSAIDSSKIAAQLADGVLTVHLPKSEAVKPRKIAVTSG